MDGCVYIGVRFSDRGFSNFLETIELEISLK